MLHHASSFAIGFKNFFSGISFLIARPRLWWFAVVPASIGLIMLVLMFVGFFHYYGDLHAWIISHVGHLHIDDPDAWWMHVLNVLLWVVDLIVQLLVVLVSAILILLSFYIATLIISAPFNDMLSERVEEEVTGVKAPPFSFRRMIRETGHTMWIEILKGLVFISVPVVSLVLLVIPAVGGICYIAVTLIFGMWDMGFTYIDYPMGRRHMSFMQRMRFAWQNKSALVGFGWIFLIPFLNFFFIAPMAVGGTLLFLACEKQQTAMRSMK
jgi:CysZ protein